ncbi:MAG: DUF4412 domain-containing protein [Bacteroidales bacterium]|nr:DUF4412 domain-containing protein [Bacteroidales bacterium]
MKKVGISLLAMFLIFGISQKLNAQKKQFTGKVIYRISFDMADIPPEASGMMPTTMAMYIGNNKVKTEIITVMGNQSTILDLNDKTHTTLMDIMGEKLAIKDTYESLMEELKNTPEYVIEATDETKEIAGHPCKKVLLKKVKEGEEVVDGELWLTTNLNLHPNFYFNQPSYKDLKGLMMEYEMDAGNNMKMKLTAVEVTGQKIKDADFEIPEDYEVITRQELSKKFGF